MKKIINGTLALICIFLLFTYSVSAEKIKYAVPMTVAAIPSYVAYDRGLWELEDLEVEFEFYSAGRLALDALLSKNAQVMSVSETPLVHAVIQGHKIFWVSTVGEHRECKFIYRTDRLKDKTDIVGKKIATLPGTNSDYFMYEYFKSLNVRPRDVLVTNLKPPDMVTSLVSGNIDGYFAWEPHCFYAKQLLGDKAIIVSSTGLYSGRHSVAMNQDFVRSNPGIVVKLIKGFIRAEKFVAENPQRAKEIVSKVTGMQLGALESLWGEYVVKVQLDNEFYNILKKEGAWAMQIKNLKGPVPDFKKYIYTDALRSVRAESIGDVFK